MCFSIVIPCISGFLWCDTSLVLLFSIQIISALPLMPILNVWFYWKERKMWEFIFEIETPRVYNSIHALWLGPVVARNKGVPMAETGVVKLRLHEKFL